MAEHSFREVMHEVNRLCMSRNVCDNDCPLENMGCCGNLGAHCSNPLQVERIEDTVTAWAAEHPEPVYPTWGEYIRNITGLDPVEVNGMRLALTRTIPADIAQKLGIEPE